MSTLERFWGLNKDTIAADQMKLDPSLWTIVMVSNQIDVSILDDCEKLDCFEHDHKWYAQVHVETSLPKGIQWVGMMHRNVPDKMRYGIIDFKEMTA